MPTRATTTVNAMSGAMPPSRVMTGCTLLGIKRVIMKQMGTSTRAMMLMTLAKTARRSGSSTAFRMTKYAMTMSMSMRYVVRRGSHVHQTPHSKRVHKSPVTIVKTTNSSEISIATREQVSNRASRVDKYRMP